MKIDYDVGDVVVCVDADGAPELVAGGYYRVTDIKVAEEWYEDAGELGTSLEGVSPTDGYMDFKASRFRKLPKADDEFTEYMRSMKPHKQPVDA